MSFTVDKTTNSKAIPTLKVPEASSANAIAKTRETGQQFSNLVRKEQKGAVNPEQQALTSVVDETRQVLEPLAKDKDAFNAVLKQAFGDDFDAGKAETLRQQILAGDYSWAPKVELVDSKQLGDTSGTQTSGRALGAYAESTDTIYLDRELVASDPEQAKAVLLEEMGHAIDARINSKDAKGDEGAIFAKLASGEKISADKMQALKSENDKGVLKIDGKEIEVEYRFLPSFFPRRKKSFGIFRPRVPKYRYSGPGSSKSTGGLSTPSIRRSRVSRTKSAPVAHTPTIRSVEASTKAKSSKPKAASVTPKPKPAFWPSPILTQPKPEPVASPVVIKPKPKPKSQGVKAYTDNGHAAAEANNPFSRVNPNNPSKLMYGPFRPDYQPAVPKPVFGPPPPTKPAAAKPVVSKPATQSQGVKTYTDNGHAAAEADNPFSRVNPNNPSGPLMHGPFRPDYEPEIVSPPVYGPPASAQQQSTPPSIRPSQNSNVYAAFGHDPTEASNPMSRINPDNPGGPLMYGPFRADYEPQPRGAQTANPYAAFGHDPAEASNPFSRVNPNNPFGPLSYGPFSPNYSDADALTPPPPPPVKLSQEEADHRASEIREAVKGGWFFGAGTDEDRLWAALDDIPSSAAVDQIRDSYKEKYGDNLDEDIVNDLGSSEEVARARNLLKGDEVTKPGQLTQAEADRRAKEVKEAVNGGIFGWGTDEDRVWAALEDVPDSGSMEQIRASYQDQFGSDMDKAIINDFGTPAEKQRARTMLQGSDRTTQSERDAAEIDFLVRRGGGDRGDKIVHYFLDMESEGGSSRVQSALNQYEENTGKRFEDGLYEPGEASSGSMYEKGYYLTGLSTPNQNDAIQSVIAGESGDSDAVVQWGAESLKGNMNHGFLGIGDGIEKESFEKTAAYFVENGRMDSVQASFEEQTGKKITTVIEDTADSSMQAEHVGTYLTQTRSERQSSDLAYEVKEKLGDDDKLLETLEGMGPEQIRQAMEADPELESTVLSSKNFRDGDLNSTQNAIKLSFENPLLDSGFNPESPQDVKKYNDWIVDYNAHALESAFAGLGTDDDKVDQILTNLTPKQLYEVTQQYDQNNDRSLSKRIKDEQGGNDEFDSMQAYEQAQKAGANPNDARYAGSQIEAANMAIANGQDPMQGIRAYIGEQARLRQETADRARSNDWNWKFSAINPALGFGAKALGSREVVDTVQKVGHWDLNYQTDNDRIDNNLNSIEQGLADFDAASTEEEQAAAINQVSRSLNLADQDIVVYRDTKNNTAKGGASVAASATAIALSGGTATPLVVMLAAGTSGGTTYYAMNQQAGGQAVAEQTALNSLNGIPISKGTQLFRQPVKALTTQGASKSAAWQVTDVVVGNGLEGGADALIEHPNLGDASFTEVASTFGKGFGVGSVTGTVLGGGFMGLGKGVNAIASHRAGKPEVLVPDQIIDPPSTRVPEPVNTAGREVIDVDGYEVKPNTAGNGHAASNGTSSNSLEPSGSQASQGAPGAKMPEIAAPKQEVIEVTGNEVVAKPTQASESAVKPQQIEAKKPPVNNGANGLTGTTPEQLGLGSPFIIRGIDGLDFNRGLDPDTFEYRAARTTDNYSDHIARAQNQVQERAVLLDPETNRPLDYEPDYSPEAEARYQEFRQRVIELHAKGELEEFHPGLDPAKFPETLADFRPDNRTVQQLAVPPGFEKFAHDGHAHPLGYDRRAGPGLETLLDRSHPNARVAFEFIPQACCNAAAHYANLNPSPVTMKEAVGLDGFLGRESNRFYNSDVVINPATNAPINIVDDTMMRIDDLGAEGTKSAINAYIEPMSRSERSQYLQDIGLDKHVLADLDTDANLRVFSEHLRRNPKAAWDTFEAVKAEGQIAGYGPKTAARMDNAITGVALGEKSIQEGIDLSDIAQVKGKNEGLDAFVTQERVRELGVDEAKTTLRKHAESQGGSGGDQYLQSLGLERNGDGHTGYKQLEAMDEQALMQWVEGFDQQQNLALLDAIGDGGLEGLYGPVAYVYKRNLEFPGDFPIIGEITGMKEAVSLHLGKEGWSATSPEFKALMHLMDETGQTVVFHHDWGKHRIDGQGRPMATKTGYEYFDSIVETLQRYPDANPVLAHTGLGRFVRPNDALITKDVTIRDRDGNVIRVIDDLEAPEHIHKLYELFDKVPNARADISWNDVGQAYTDSQAFRDSIVDFMVNNNKRLVFGSDTVKPVSGAHYTQAHYAMSTVIAEVARKDPDAAFRLFEQNYSDLLNKDTLPRLRTWTEQELTGLGRTDDVAAMHEKAEILDGYRSEMSDRARLAFDQWVSELGPEPAISPRFDNPGAIAQIYESLPDSKKQEWMGHNHDHGDGGHHHHHDLPDNGLGTAGGTKQGDSKLQRAAVRDALGFGGGVFLTSLSGVHIPDAVNMLAFSTRGVSGVAKANSVEKWVETFEAFAESNDPNIIASRGLLSRETIDEVIDHLIKNQDVHGFDDAQVFQAIATLEQTYANHSLIADNHLDPSIGGFDKHGEGLVIGNTGIGNITADRSLGAATASIQNTDARAPLGKTMNALGLGTLAINDLSTLQWLAEGKFDLTSPEGITEFAFRSLFGLGNAMLTGHTAVELFGGLRGISLASTKPMQKLQANQSNLFVGAGAAWTANDAIHLMNTVFNSENFMAGSTSLGITKTFLDAAFTYYAARVAMDGRTSQKLGMNRPDKQRLTAVKLLAGAVALRTLIGAFEAASGSDDKKDSALTGAPTVVDIPSIVSVSPVKVPG